MKTINGHARAIKCHAYCRNDLCSQADVCVFHRAAVACSSTEAFVPSLNLLFYPDSGNLCRFYCTEKRIKAAWGISKLYDSVPHAEVRALRKKIIEHIGRSKYYWICRHETYPLSEELNLISDLFSNLDADVKPVYECYTEESVW